LLLPLVEAAIRQGIEPHDRGGRVALVARGAAGLLELTVTDDGATRVVESQGGIAAVRERLAGLYGERGRLDLIAIPGGGMTARIEVPYEADPRRPR
jgi:LytS/YehU family sensor histidine kinase